MTERSPRLSRLRRVVPESRTGRPVEARGARPRRRGAQPKVVALGGGMGLSASLAALRRITGDLTAVVTVADDGGSSGRLRDELGVLPPGDLRKALAALCGDDDWGQTWARVIQHRFQSKGDLHEHERVLRTMASTTLARGAAIAARSAMEGLRAFRPGVLHDRHEPEEQCRQERCGQCEREHERID